MEGSAVTTPFWLWLEPHICNMICVPMVWGAGRVRCGDLYSHTPPLRAERYQKITSTKNFGKSIEMSQCQRDYCVSDHNCDADTCLEIQSNETKQNECNNGQTKQTLRRRWLQRCRCKDCYIKALRAHFEIKGHVQNPLITVFPNVPRHKQIAKELDKSKKLMKFQSMKEDVEERKKVIIR